MNLEIIRRNKGFVNWQYSASVEGAEVQFEAFEKILEPQTMEKFSKVLSEIDGSIYSKSFKSSDRTAPETQAPEYVQKAICFMAKKNELGEQN